MFRDCEEDLKLLRGEREHGEAFRELVIHTQPGDSGRAPIPTIEELNEFTDRWLRVEHRSPVQIWG